LPRGIGITFEILELRQNASRLVFSRPRLARLPQRRVMRWAFGDRDRTARMKATT